jgi:hypothetical protein
VCKKKLYEKFIKILFLFRLAEALTACGISIFIELGMFEFNIFNCALFVGVVMLGMLIELIASLPSLFAWLLWIILSIRFSRDSNFDLILEFSISLWI